MYQTLVRSVSSAGNYARERIAFGVHYDTEGFMRFLQIAGASVASALLLAGCSGGNGTPPTSTVHSEPAMSNSSFEDLSFQTALNTSDASESIATPVRTVSRAMPQALLAGSASEPLILATMVETGLNQTGVPCINCVSGAQTSANVGLTYPLSYVAATVPSLQYVFFFSDFNFTGKCKFSVTVTAGTTVLFNAPFSLNVTPGFQTYSATGGSRPSYTGPALLVGKIVCPHTAVTTAKSTMYFQ